jgi:hypothetical protein
MKLYVIDRDSRQKKYLNAIAQNRKSLLPEAQQQTIAVDGHIYEISEVKAEPEEDSTAVGGLIGGIIGALAGGPGVIIGGVIGAAIGKAQLEKQKKEAEIFNRSEP